MTDPVIPLSLGAVEVQIAPGGYVVMWLGKVHAVFQHPDDLSKALSTWMHDRVEYVLER